MPPPTELPLLRNYLNQSPLHRFLKQPAVRPPTELAVADPPNCSSMASLMLLGLAASAQLLKINPNYTEAAEVKEHLAGSCSLERALVQRSNSPTS